MSPTCAPERSQCRAVKIAREWPISCSRKVESSHRPLTAHLNPLGSCDLKEKHGFTTPFRRRQRRMRG